LIYFHIVLKLEELILKNKVFFYNEKSYGNV